MSDNLSDLKPSDTVVLCGRYGVGYRVVKVDLVTATQAIIGNSKFRLDGGTEIGGDKWSRTSISQKSTKP